MPTKKPEDVRRYTFQFRLTQSERERYERAAKRAKMDLSSWFRHVAEKAAR